MAVSEALLAPRPVWPAHYLPFFSPATGQPVDACFRLGLEQRRPPDAGFVPSFGSGVVQYGAVEGRQVLRFQIPRMPPYLVAEPDDGFRTVDVWLRQDESPQVPPLTQPVDRVLCMGLLADRGGFTVHSCGWTCNGKAVVFPGVSGAGKTTLCRQLLATGQGAVLSDDRVVLRETPAGFQAWGTPWAGDAKQACNQSAPLVALCFLEKSPAHCLTSIAPAEALRRLLQTTAVPWFLPDPRDRVLSGLDRLVSAVPAFRLGFHPDPSVIDVLQPLMKMSHGR